MGEEYGRVAIVHDWTTGYSGAERVLEALLELFPLAKLFCVADFVPADQRKFFRGHTPQTTFVQRIPFSKKYFLSLMPVMPLAVEQFDLHEFDLIISSSFAFAKGVITGPDQVHLCYCHSPIRYVWDLEHEYRHSDRRLGVLKKLVSRLAFHYIRLWDIRTGNGVDQFIANSQFVSRRINKIYRRDTVVVYPPVDLGRFTVGTAREDFYLAAGRLVGYKRFDVLLDTFRRTPHRKLVIVGHGPELARLRSNAPRNVQFLGWQPFDILCEQLRRCRAFLFAGIEDFGIVIAEAQACGTPVICYCRGGASEIVIDGVTGVFFGEQTTESIGDAIVRFEAIESSFDRNLIRLNAERFSSAAFRENFMATVRSVVGARRSYSSGSPRAEHIESDHMHA